MTVPNVDDAAAFYVEALELKVQRAVPGRGAMLGDGTSCGLVLLAAQAAQGGAAAAAQQQPAEQLRAPYFTVGVSNLKTAARHAKRKGGEVGT
jgi:predicted enzyme related to lactoylglutathione lyase